MAKALPASIKAATARELALHVLRDVFGAAHRGAQESLEYRAARAEMDAREVALATELAYGTVKMRRRLEWHLRPYVQARLHTLPEPIRELLFLGAYQLLLMEGVAEHAAVFETVDLARRLGHRGTAGLVNAVLRRIQRDRPAPPRAEAFHDDDDYLGTLHSYPTWIVQAWRERFGARLVEILEACNRPARTALRVNTLRCGIDEARARLAERGVPTHLSTLAADCLLPVSGRLPRDLELGGGGRWNLQGEAACVPAHLLAVQPGQTVFDLCCGRGHKSLQLAALLANRGTLRAVDDHAGRLKALATAASVMGADCIHAVDADLMQPWPRALQRADRILLDAPCSGLGILGRAPEARWRKRPDDPARLAQAQQGLLQRALTALASGGRLVYTVCSTDPREGDQVVEAAVAEGEGLRVVRPPERLAGYACGPGIMIPPGIDGRDGFFIAAIERPAS